MAADNRTPWQESQAIRPPASVMARTGAPEAFPLGAYDPATRQFAAPSGLAGSRERAVEAAFAPQAEGGIEYSDYEGAGGWGYRLYDDGSVKIIKAPEGHKAGAKLSGGAAFDAIWREIGSKAPAFSTQNGPKAGGVHEAQPVNPTAMTVPQAVGAAVNVAEDAALPPASTSMEDTRETIAPGAELIRKLRGT